MADITKCSTEDCPLGDKCYRKTAVSNPLYQARGNFPVVNSKCDFYMRTGTEKETKYDQTPL